MSKLDTLRCAQIICAGVVLLRQLGATRTEMPYGTFCKSVGIWLEDQPWHVSMRDQLGDTLNAMAAISRQAGDPELPFELLVRADSGRAGTRLLPGSPDLDDQG